MAALTLVFCAEKADMTSLAHISCPDDMLFSPDFLRYFEAMAVLLERDHTLFCISAWNDNGRQEDFRWDNKRMVRKFGPNVQSCLCLRTLCVPSVLICAW
jgi:hypothetical protein